MRNRSALILKDPHVIGWSLLGVRLKSDGSDLEDTHSLCAELESSQAKEANYLIHITCINALNPIRLLYISANRKDLRTLLACAKLTNILIRLIF